MLCRLETVNIKNKAGLAKIIGALLALIGAMVLTLYKGVPLTHKTTHQIRPLHTTNIGTNNSPKKWMLGSIALLGNAFSFSFWMLLQSKVTKKYPVVYSGTVLMSFMSFLQVVGLSMAIERRTSIWIPKGKLEIMTVIYAVSGYLSIAFGNLFICNLQIK